MHLLNRSFRFVLTPRNLFVVAVICVVCFGASLAYRMSDTTLRTTGNVFLVFDDHESDSYYLRQEFDPLKAPFAGLLCDDKFRRLTDTQGLSSEWMPSENANFGLVMIDSSGRVYNPLSSDEAKEDRTVGRILLYRRVSELTIAVGNRSITKKQLDASGVFGHPGEHGLPKIQPVRFSVSHDQSSGTTQAHASPLSIVSYIHSVIRHGL